MRDFTRALAGLGAKVRNQTIVLRQVPAIAETEAMLGTRGAEWLPAFETKCRETSLALFGITEADTRPIEPHPDSYDKNTGPLSRIWFSAEASAKYEAALSAWYDWQEIMGVFEAGITELGARRFWFKNGIDVTDGEYDPLRCLPYFSRQLYVAVKSLLPGASLSLDGSGKRAAQSVEDWGAALAAEAAKFRPSRRP